ncbi:MAG: DEAD/DEAH box helicase, partial [Clostridia bacterium]|nr:DEAD/DEAH box helicase [Clostridia bacterium]
MARKKTDLILSADSPLSVLSGISDARSAAFASVGVHTLSDLCRFYPRTYEDRGTCVRVSDAAALAAEDDPQKVSLILTVSTRPVTAKLPGRKTVTKFAAVDETGQCSVTYFNQPYIGTAFAVGQTYRFYGKVSLYNKRLSLVSPAYEPVPESEGDPLPSLYPVYRCPEGLTQKKIAKAISQALLICYPDNTEIPDLLPDEIRERYGLCSARFALFTIHQPENWKDLETARKRLSFEELFRFALSLRFHRNLQRAAAPRPVPRTDLSPFLSVHPFSLTGAQERVIREIRDDLSSPDHPMNRILIGDVGSGKTVCAAAAIYCSVKAGMQAALMAPTEILARQHYLDLCPMFESLGISCGLLVGSLSAAGKKARKAELRSGTLSVIIGTHALLEDDTVFSDLGLVVIDEQHRFGVEQRERLRNKARSAHLLMMSATPIPRTLALT